MKMVGELDDASFSRPAAVECSVTVLDARHTLPDSPSPQRLTAVSATWEAFVDRFVPLVYGFCRERGLTPESSHSVTERSLSLLYRLWHRFGQREYRLNLSDWLKMVVVREIARTGECTSASRATGGGTGPSADLLSEASSRWPAAFRCHVFQVALEEVRGEFNPEWWQLFLRSWRDGEPASVIALSYGKPREFVYKVRFRVLHRIREHAEHLCHALPAVGRPDPSEEKSE